MDCKELKKLAATCRKAGIKTFKNAEVEFTLSDEAPVSIKRYGLQKASQSDTNSELQVTDTLTEDQLLMWSSQDLLATTEENQ